MGTAWETSDFRVSFRGLAKPYQEGTVDLKLAHIRKVIPSSDGLSVEVHTASREPGLSVIAYFDKAGYIDHAQRVTFTLLDDFILQVSFAQQLPMNVTEYYLQKDFPGHVGIVCGRRTIIMRTSSRPLLDQVAKDLWQQLIEQHVVRGSMPALRPAR